MANYKKHILLSVLVLIILIGIITPLMKTPSLNVYIIGIISIIIAVMVAIICLLIIHIYYVTSVMNNIPDILKNMTRNYDMLILGERKNEFACNEKSFLDLTNINRNFYTDILILERYHSFLRRQGLIVFHIDCGNTKYLNDNKISEFDARFLHRVTLMEHNIYKNYFGWLFRDSITGVKYVLFKLFKIKSPKIEMEDKEFNNIFYKMSRINSFCAERNLYVEYKLINWKYKPRKSISEIRCQNVIVDFTGDDRHQC